MNLISAGSISLDSTFNSLPTPNIARNCHVIWKDLFWSSDSYRLLKFQDARCACKFGTFGNRAISMSTATTFPFWATAARVLLTNIVSTVTHFHSVTHISFWSTTSRTIILSHHTTYLSHRCSLCSSTAHMKHPQNPHLPVRHHLPI